MDNIQLRPVQEADLPAVMEIEKASMSMTWSQGVWMNELTKNQLANHVVACASVFNRQSSIVNPQLGEGEERIVGYAGCWIVVDEATIVNIAVSPEWRRKKIGERLLVALLELAKSKGANKVTLEVRCSNEAAIKLYEKFGFTMIAMRKNYYQNPVEDAYVYWMNPLVVSQQA